MRLSRRRFALVVCLMLIISILSMWFIYQNGLEGRNVHVSIEIVTEEDGNVTISLIPDDPKYPFRVSSSYSCEVIGGAYNGPILQIRQMPEDFDPNSYSYNELGISWLPYDQLFVPDFTNEDTLKLHWNGTINAHNPMDDEEPGAYDKEYRAEEGYYLITQGFFISNEGDNFVYIGEEQGVPFYYNGTDIDIECVYDDPNGTLSVETTIIGDEGWEGLSCAIDMLFTTHKNATYSNQTMVFENGMITCTSFIDLEQNGGYLFVRITTPDGKYTKTIEIS